MSKLNQKQIEVYGLEWVFNPNKYILVFGIIVLILSFWFDLGLFWSGVGLLIYYFLFYVRIVKRVYK